MIQTPTIRLSKYELTDAANLADGYNNSMDILDETCAEMIARFPIQTDDIADRAVTSSKLNNGSVTTDKIVDANVTNSKLASKAITIDKISDEALKDISDNVITSLDNGNITNSMLADDSVTSDKLATNSVTSDKLAINSVTSDKLATNSVTSDKLAINSVTSDKLAINSVTTSSIANGSITSDKLADNITFQPMFMPKRGDVSVCFGDSNAVGHMLNNPSTENFYYQICQQLGLEYHNYSVNGSGFATANNILAQVKAAAADTAITKDSVKFVILLAGRNDYFNSSFSAAQIAPSIREVINTIYTTFPNAIIFAGDMDWSYYYPTLADMTEMRKIRAAYLSTEAPVVVVPTWHVGLDASMNN